MEVITVASTVSLLLSLSVPALQTARNSSREVMCKSRLKQIGLALHNYHDVFNSFAPGWTSRRGEGEGHPTNGWQFSILPYMGEVQLFNQLNGNNVYEPNDQNTEILKTPVESYRCTSDSVGPTNPFRGGWGTSNFSGNHGSVPIPRWSASEFWPGQTVANSGYQQNRSRNSHPNGIFQMNRCIKLRDIVDGTSNTLAVGERCVVGRSGIWPGPRSNFHESDVVSDASFSSPLNRSDTGFSSRHAGGVITFLFCDGAIHDIQEGINSQPISDKLRAGGILQLLSNREDGQPIVEDMDSFK